jgi:hypothetical protein
VFEPRRWLDKYGYRKLTLNERKAGFKVWQEIGTAMHIKDIPETVEDMERFNIEYEQKHFRFTLENQEVANDTVNMLLGWYLPQWTFPLAKSFLTAVMDKPLLDAVGFKEPNVFVKISVSSFFGLRKMIVRLLPKRSTPLLRTELPNRTYPEGYDIANLGPEQFKNKAAD